MPTINWPPRGYHTIAAAAAQLGLSRQRVYQILVREDIRPVTVGRSALLTTAQVRQLRTREKGKAGRPRKRHNESGPV